MANRWLLCLLALVACGENKLVATQNVEYHDKGEVRYALYMDRVIFEEAKQTCLFEHGSLVEFHTSAVAEYVTRSMAESAVGFSSLWIGGQYTPGPGSRSGVWKWLSGDKIATEPLAKGEKFPMETLPYWGYKPDLGSNERACLVVDRINHRRPVIGGVSCFSRRPFICALPLYPTKGPHAVGPTFISKGKRFHLYQAEFTWGEALGFCRSLSYELGVVTEPNEFVKLQTRMKRARPKMENAWTSGAFIEGKWIWVTANEEIRTDKEVYKKKGVSIPWHKVDDNTTDICLLADRHGCNSFAYAEARCDTPTNVICQEHIEKEPTPDMFKKLYGSDLFISTLELPWLEAHQMCKSCLEGGSLLQLATNNETLLQLQTKWLFTAMSELMGSETKHIWLNARLQGEVFNWERDPEGKSKEEFKYPIDSSKFSKLSVLNDKGEVSSINYCPGDVKGDETLRAYQCLNLDRENLKEFFVYGLSCDLTQHFICTARNNQSTLLSETCKKTVLADAARQLEMMKTETIPPETTTITTMQELTSSMIT